MRMFTKQVFNDYVEGAITAHYSSAELNSLLAGAEKLYLQARVSKVSGTSPTFTLKLEHSNDGKEWATLITLLNASSLTAGQLNNLFGKNENQIPGAFVRVSVALGGTDPTAQVTVLATGRGEQVTAVGRMHSEM